MDIVIAGDGEVGFFLAKILTEGDHNIVVIDPNEDLIKRLESEADVMAIKGDSTSLLVLDEANVAKADLLISVLHEEKSNILTCILGKKMGVKRTIARINSVEYLTERNKNFFKELGIDELIAPEVIAANEIVSLLKQTAATEVVNFSGGKLQMLQIRLSKDAPVTGKSLLEVTKEYPDLNFRTVALHRKGKTIIPKAHDRFLSNDLLYIITKPDAVELLIELSGRERFSISNVMIVGAGRIGRKTARELQGHKNVKLIDINRQRSEEAAALLAKTLVINGDAHNVQLLENEGIGRMDAFIAVTQDSEINIFSCLLALRYGVKKVIPLIENIDYIDIAQNIGIETAINKKLITASYIARFTMNVEVESVTFLSGIDADALEFIVKEGAPITKKPLRKISMPEGAIIGGYIRQNRGYIAIGETVFLQGDKVVVLSLPHVVSKVEKLFNK
ncbi:MAG: Trk system potassium transporter TrkA [Bacteroidales bacterium]|jgi:trk system potassium uptake protein TrkA|nr:Trk system potassium transporter TrkA [Bacteroidales bacterium]